MSGSLWYEPFFCIVVSFYTSYIFKINYFICTKNKKDAHIGHRAVKLLLKVDISLRAVGADTDTCRRFLVALLTSISQVAFSRLPYAISHRLNGQDKVESRFNTFLLIEQFTV